MGAEFGRELNASDDRAALAPFRARRESIAVLEGKHLEPFRTSPGGCRYELRPGALRTRAPARARLAYRDVASATNRLTLIAAIVPPGAVTTHTLFCLRKAMPLDAQHALCGLLNSFVANYLVRLRVNTHVTVALVTRLPVPVVRRGDPSFDRLSALSRALSRARTPIDAMPEYAELQALAARMYGLGADDWRHILGTFPLIDEEVRSKAFLAFNSLH